MEQLSEGFIDKINKMNDHFQGAVRLNGLQKSGALAAGAMGGLLVGSAPVAVGLFLSTLLANVAFRVYFLKKVAKCLGEKVGEEAIEALRVQKTFDGGSDINDIESRKSRKVLQDIRAKLVKKGC